MATKRPIVTMDFETDPFKHGRKVEPFSCGIYNGTDFYSSWGRDCTDKALKHLTTLPPSIIYLHNGGRFDIFFFIQHLSGTLKIINNRIVSAHLGEHEIRDSFALLPFGLSKYKKDEIDIDKLQRHCREKYKTEILSYLRGDCIYLHELVTSFHTEFGDYLTIGSASIAELQKFHPFIKGDRFNDERFRDKFFFGGRVQCFKSGIIKQPFKIFDVNSMYPHVMRNFKHPDGVDYFIDNKVSRKTAFVIAEGRNFGAFPIRTKKGLDFTTESGTYAITVHEWNAAMDTRTFRPSRILRTYNFNRWISFDGFVDHFFNGRKIAKEKGDKILELFYKFVLNSAYGKFAQNPNSFKDFTITQGGQALAAPWSPTYVYEDGRYVIWQKPVTRHSYFNVAIGASITGAARSVLLRAIHAAKDPLYCDTDSIIARDLKGVNFSETQLGGWKNEGHGTSIAIAGKKLYACFDGSKCIKSATKGARISAAEIKRVARGEMVVYKKDAPTFKLDGRVEFIRREIRRTA